MVIRPVKLRGIARNFSLDRKFWKCKWAFVLIIFMGGLRFRPVKAWNGLGGFGNGFFGLEIGFIGSGMGLIRRGLSQLRRTVGL